MMNQIIYKTILGGLITLLIVATIWAIRGSGKVQTRHRHEGPISPEDDPILYLQELYAKGEIDKKEYEARKKHLAA